MTAQVRTSITDRQNGADAAIPLPEEPPEPSGRPGLAPTLSLPITCDRRTVRGARSACRAAFESWGLPEGAADDAVTIVSELVTNAAVHGRGPAWLRVVVIGREVKIAVFDSGPVTPALRTAINWPDSVVGAGLTPAWAVVNGDALDADDGATTPDGADDLGGRGLLVVSSLAARAWLVDRAGGGKTVMAYLVLPEPVVGAG